MASGRVVALAVICASILFPAGASAQDDFFANKTLKIVVGYPPGSTFDLYARALSRHMGRHLAGHPTVIVQNMPGAGGLNAVKFVAGAAVKDGLTLALSNPQSTTAPLLDPKSANFDPRKFNWLGSLSDDTTVCAFWAKDIRTADDLAKREIVIGATGITGGSAIDGRLLNELFGLRFKIVTGYPGMIEVRLAAERGEVDGQCGLPGSTIKIDLMDQVASGKITVPVQLGLRPNPDLPAVPNVLDRISSPEEKAIFRLVYAPLSYMRPVMAPEGVPADRVASLRAAFSATLVDKIFLAEMAAIKLDVRPVSHEMITSLISEIYDAPKPIVERVQRLLGVEGR